MTMKLTEESTVFGIWYVPVPNADLLAFVMAHETDASKIVVAMRVRAYVDDKAFDSDDVKDGFVVNVAVSKKEVYVARMKESAEDFWRKFGGFKIDVFAGGTGAEAIEWLRSQDWAHMTSIPLSERSSATKP